MSSLAVVKSSDDGQIEDLDKAFSPVAKRAAAYETLEARANDALYDALADLFSFGENLRAEAMRLGRPLLEEFVARRGERWNAVTARNPYNALVALAFTKSNKASVSQFSRVLQHAHDRGINAAALRSELATLTIKGAYQAAVEFYDNAKHRSAQAKIVSRIAAAKALLSSQSLSAPIKLNTPKPLAAGYASVLVRINDQNQAEIVSVLDTDESRLVLVAAGDVAPASDALADNPLFSLYRAVDIVLKLTPERTKSNERRVLVCNVTTNRGRICRVMAISAAYNYPWAFVDIQPLSGLADDGHVLDHAQALAFVQRFDQGTWSITSLGSGDLMLSSTPNVGASVALPRYVPTSGTFVGSSKLERARAFTLSQREAATFSGFLGTVHSHFEKLAETSGEVSQPKRLALECEGRTASLRIVSPNGGSSVLSSPLFTLDAEATDFEKRFLALADVRQLCAVVSKHEFEMAGWFGSNEEKDVALILEGNIGDDAVGLVIPTVVGASMEYAHASDEYQA